MIDICIITPISCLGLSQYGDREFCLAQLLGNPTYRDYYRAQSEAGRWVILDNGAHENKAPTETNEALVARAIDIGASEVIAPDVLYDCNQTIERTTTFLDQWKFEDATKVMGVAQGSSFDEWLHCYMTFYQDPRVDTIGITYDTPPEYSWGKYPTPISVEQKYMLDRLRKLEMLDKDGLAGKPIHLLGMVNLLELIYVAFRFEFVRSWDSSNTIIRAFLRKSYGDYSSLVERHGKTELREKFGLRYFTTALTPEQYDIAKENIRIVKSFTQGHGRGWLDV